MDESFGKLLQAVAFAARAHQGQMRKDGRTPYVSHVFRVCLVLRHVFGVDDLKALTAAVLHDTVEDTTADFDEIEDEFGSEIAQWVALLSKDKRLAEPEREEGYTIRLAKAPWQVKVCKLADIYDNLVDSAMLTPEKRAKVFKRSHQYLDALRHHLPPEAERPWQLAFEQLGRAEA